MAARPALRHRRDPMNNSSHQNRNRILTLITLSVAASLTSCTTVVQPDVEPTTNTTSTTTRKSSNGYPSSTSTETRTTQSY